MEKQQKHFELWHNPQCSKSRQALSLLQERSVPVQVVEYIKSPPTAAKLKEVLNLLGLKPIELVRKGEDIFKELKLSTSSSDDTLIKAMIAHPKLIERPILITSGQAVVGRPPQNVLTLL